jgi:hypothetical protein
MMCCAWFRIECYTQPGTEVLNRLQVADAKADNFKSMSDSPEGQQMLSNQVLNPKPLNLKP